MKTGILVVNKEEGLTSHDVVSILRKKLNIKRIGHTGTLDPLATGVLPICIGNATRVSSYIMEQGKTYIATLEFGSSTSTYDSSGDIIESSDLTEFSDDIIKEVLNTFLGKIEQTPPIYSALKVDGKKLYEYAREGKTVEIKSRKVEIYDIRLLENNANQAKIEVSCSKGTYIRSLIHDIGIKLGSFAHMTGLIRTRVGKFYLEDSISTEEIKEIELERLLDRFVKTDHALYNLQKLNIEEDIKQRLINGQRININSLDSIADIRLNENEDIVVYVDSEFIGIGKIIDNILKMEKVLCQE